MDLDTAITLASKAHHGQKDKAGQPYILHSLRVMMRQTDDTRRIVAVLHDVAEDFESGRELIHGAGFGQDVLDAIDAITRNDGEDYFDYIARVAGNAIAREVKLDDVADNLSKTRPCVLSDSQIRRYWKAQLMLLQAAPTA